MNSMIRRLVHRIPCCLNNLPTSCFCKVEISPLLNNLKTVLKDSRYLYLHYTSNANLAKLCGPTHMQPVRSSSYRVQILTYLQMSKNFLRHTYNSEDTKKKKERNEKIKERNKRKRNKKYSVSYFASQYKPAEYSCTEFHHHFLMVDYQMLDLGHLLDQPLGCLYLSDDL